MRQEPPNIILIVMDTARADHLSCYGYHRNTSPNINKIAERGILFENAFSAAIWSPPSHASIFTGKYPSYHKTLGRNIYLSPHNATLAGVLGANGYSTIGITNCRLLGVGTGFDRGFQRYIEPSKCLPLPKELGEAETLSMALELLTHAPKDLIRTLTFGPDEYSLRTTGIIKAFIESRRESRKPFFLFANFFNCHAPYDPPRPFKGRFCNGFTEPRLYIMELVSEKIFRRTQQRIFDNNVDINKLLYVAAGASEARFRYMAKELEMSEEEWEVIRAWYDGEIAYLDHCIGELLSFLCCEGIFDDTLIIITADHGEDFGEHGLASHHFGLYDSLLHVPLIMSCPFLMPTKKRLPQTVSTVDILPTVLSLCNIDIKCEIQGEPLEPFEKREVHDFVCAECGESVTKLTPFERFNSKLRSVDKGSKCIRNPALKYILHPGGREELYNTVDDPFEENNIVHQHPNTAKSLKRQLERTLDITYFGPKETFHDEKDRAEMMKRLRALGYV